MSHHDDGDDGDGGGARNCVKHNCKVLNNVLICIEHIVLIC